MFKVGEIYKDGEGNDVRIICVDRKSAYGVPLIGLVKRHDNEQLSIYTLKGKVWDDEDCTQDLIPPKKFPFNRGDVVEVSEDNQRWFPRVFSHEADGYVYTYNNSDLKWTPRWSFCREFKVTN